MQQPDPFHYHAPNEITAPKYAAINAAADALTATLATILVTDPVTGANAWAGDHMAHHDLKAGFDAINAGAKTLYDTIREHAPDCDDRATAERFARLARMAANHHLAKGMPGGSIAARAAFENILIARWSACAAVALGSV